jgi:hypothetical protein
MIRIAAHIITPVYVTSFLSAVRLLHPGEDVELTLLVFWGAAGSDAVRGEMAECVRAMTCGLPSPPRIVAVAEADMEAILRRESPEDVSAAARAAFGLPELDEFHYGHATVGCFAQLMASAFPQARRVCFGDVFGMVHWRRERLAYAGVAVKALPRLNPDDAGEALRWACAERDAGRGSLQELLAEREIAPHLAALGIPIDQFGDYFDSVPLRVYPRAVVLDVLRECAASAEELGHYIKSILAAHADRPKFLLLTANFAEADDLSPETDVAMYAAVVRESCPPGSTILLKTHPGETIPRAERLRGLLAPDYLVVELDRRFRRYPIEIWTEAVQQCGIVCITSPAVTLAYFYGKKVFQPLDEAFINRWWAPEKRPFRKLGLLWIRCPLENLPGWDEQSPLYSACILPEAHHANEEGQ